jgi:hypothetical protein
VVRERIVAALTSPNATDPRTLALVLRLLAKWRQQKMDLSIARANGSRVLTGPFAGMVFVAQGTHGSLAPKLLGTYEHELQGVIDTIIAAEYEAVVNIGAAEGYYAIGLARRMPKARILAHDTDAKAQTVCRHLAATNGVSARVTVGGAFNHADFAVLAGTRAVVLCDIEGAEKDLLEPQRAPALAGIDILVECHDCFVPGVTELIAGRFSSTHAIEQIMPAAAPATLPPRVSYEDELDRLIATWEWRTGVTQWLWMRSKG